MTSGARVTRQKTPSPSRRSLSQPARPDPTPLLLASGLEVAQVAGLLTPYALRDIAQADANIQAMAGEPHTRRQLAEILGPLLEATAQTANPDQALNHWERMLSSGVTRSTFLEYIRASPRIRDLLCAIFGNSDSLAFTLIRDPMLIYWLAEQDILSKPPSRRSTEGALRRNLANLTATELKLEALRRFRRREMLRIGVRDLLRFATVPQTTAALSDLASVLIQAAYEIVEADLRAQYGGPMHCNRQGRAVETGFAVIGMGKLGGHELNYSSDVDLIYVYESADGSTKRRSGNRSKHNETNAADISNEEYFELLARRLSKALADQTPEGYVFRVDLRLRAEGSVGRLARSLDEYAKYYETRGQVWERLALIKARPVAGSAQVGQAFLRVVKPFVFGVAGEQMDMASARSVVEEVRAVKDMIDEKMADRGHERRNVKLGVGGIREIEFLAQTIQVIAGKEVPGIVDRSTLGALARFQRNRLLSGRQRASLEAAYLFLRDVEHKLQMVHDLQTHALPEAEEELQRCAIRTGYGSENRQTALSRFRADHARHTKLVHDAFRDLFHTPKTSVLLRATFRAMEKGHRGRSPKARRAQRNIR
jgi:glutamate-ammonia-ligase adenylyltransferase